MSHYLFCVDGLEASAMGKKDSHFFFSSFIFFHFSFCSDENKLAVASIVA